MSMANKVKLKAVDFFCGGGGMSYGMKLGDVKILAGIDHDSNCQKTYEANIPGAKFIQADVFKLTEQELEKQLDLKRNDDNLILIGCSPCQFWSIIKTDKSKSEKSKNLLVEFERFVKYFNPGYVVVENVPGVLRKKSESGLADFIKWLEDKENGFKVHFDIHNVSDFGVPQNRNRFTLIASRIGTAEIIPVKKSGEKLRVKDVLGALNGFPAVNAGTQDTSSFLHSVSKLSELNMKRVKAVSLNGGDRLDFAKDESLQLKCFRGKDSSFKDSYSRIFWDKPSPTITTKFFSISNGRFIHPEEHRGLSLREGAVLQSFPKKYKFYGSSLASIARIIGNAVPPEYAKRIAWAIKRNSINHS